MEEWIAVPDETGRDYWVVRRKEDHYAVAIVYHQVVSGEIRCNAETNAKLIAAVHELLAVARRAEQLAQIAWDWDLGTDGEVEIDGEWVSTLALRNEFAAAIAKAKGD